MFSVLSCSINTEQTAFHCPVLCCKGKIALILIVLYINYISLHQPPAHFLISPYSSATGNACYFYRVQWYDTGSKISVPANTFTNASFWV